MGMDLRESDDSDVEDDDGNENENGNANGNGNNNDANEFDIFALNNVNMGTGSNVNVNGYDMGFGAGFDSVVSQNGQNGNEMGQDWNDNSNDKGIVQRINILQERAKDGIEKLVDNKAYTAENPSMGDL